jgi:chromate transporter
VERRRWLDGRESEDAIAACNLLPGPVSTQLAIFSGLLVILALSALSSMDHWIEEAGAAVSAVAVQAGWSLARDTRSLSPGPSRSSATRPPGWASPARVADRLLALVRVHPPGGVALRPAAGRRQRPQLPHEN